MAGFEVKVIRIDDVIEHPNADRLTIVKIGGYSCISNKKEDGSWRYQKGDLVVYIPEQAVLPEWLLKKMGFWKDGKGMLAGSQGNRVKAIKLRGVLSQGVLYPVNLLDSETGEKQPAIVDGTGISHQVSEGMDTAEILGIVKYEPAIPSHMSGEVVSLFGHTVPFDVENFQKYPDIFDDLDCDVVVTEKIHGTFCCLCVSFDEEVSNNVDLLKHWHTPGRRFAYSKGLGAKGLVFKDCPGNDNNIYMQTLKDKADSLTTLGMVSEVKKAGAVYVLGEIFGKGVQDLYYGFQQKTFRVFDIYVGLPGHGWFLNHDQLRLWCDVARLDMVPVLYKGPWDLETVENLRDGLTAFNGANIREGVVVKPIEERRNDKIGRLMAKLVSPDYLLRKGGSEFN